MKTDTYTKIVLTLIAVGLFASAGVKLIEDANAQTEVYIAGGEVGIERADLRYLAGLIN